MYDHAAGHLALQSRAITLSVKTTGSATLAATTSGYTRSAGSFVTDGFVAGMEVKPTGFTDTTPRLITDVAALTLTVDVTVDSLSVQSAGSGRTLVTGLPTIREWQNVAIQTPVKPRRHSIHESYAPATQEQITSPYDGGLAEETGLYLLRWEIPENTGWLAIDTCVNALLALFTPGTAFTAGSSTLRVRGDIAPWASGLVNQGNGRASRTITIPWRVFSRTTVAA